MEKNKHVNLNTGVKLKGTTWCISVNFCKAFFYNGQYKSVQCICVYVHTSGWNDKAESSLEQKVLNLALVLAVWSMVLRWKTEKTTSFTDITSSAVSGPGTQNNDSWRRLTLQVSNFGQSLWFSGLFCIPSPFWCWTNVNIVNKMYLWKYANFSWVLSYLTWRNISRRQTAYFLFWEVFQVYLLVEKMVINKQILF